MFCDRCGTEIRGEQKFCSSCGKEIAPMGLNAQASRLSRHLHLLGVLWVAYAALGLVGAAVILTLSRTIFSPGAGVLHPTPDFPTLPMFMHSMFHVIFIFVLIKSAGAALAGFGLLNKQAWARPLALVWAFLSMLNIPIGMALGIYTLWVLLSPSADEEYRRMAANA